MRSLLVCQSPMSVVGNSFIALVVTVATWEVEMTLYIDGSWSGWSGDTIVQLTDGSVWRQEEYHYEYHYAYRPKVEVVKGKMSVAGMRKAVKVRRL